MKPEEYKALFEKHNVTPIQGNYLKKEDGREGVKYCAACAVGIRAIDAAGGFDAAKGVRKSGIRFNEMVPNETLMFGMGLSDGWEGLCMSTHCDKFGKPNEDYGRGYDEGHAAAQAIKPIHGRDFGYRLPYE